MAIVIPSKNIFNKQNSKILDNVIERIEVGAVEVAPDNDYEATVYNANISFDLNSLTVVENSDKEKYTQQSNSMDETMEYDGGYVYFDNKVKYLESTIIIPKQQNNKVISKLYYGNDDENDNKVKYSLRLNKTSKSVSATVKLGYTTTELVSKSYGEVVDEGNKTQEDINLPLTIKNTEGGIVVSVEGLKDETNMSVNVEDDGESYKLSYKVLVYMYSEWYTGGYSNVIGSPGYTTQTITAKGMVEEYTPLALEITVYGDTIGIDLKDKTVYINGDTAKKVESFSGNELMQTGSSVETTADASLVKFDVDIFAGVGYLVMAKRTTDDTSYALEIKTTTVETNKDKTFVIPEGEMYTAWGEAYLTPEGIPESFKVVSVKKVLNIVKYMYDNTLKQYEKGKETATVTCYFSDYYDNVRGKKNTLYNMRYKDDTFIVLNENAHSICLQYYGDDDTYQDRGEISSINGEGKYSFKFTKSESFSRLGVRVFVNSEAYTAVTFDASNLTNGEQYTAVLNITKYAGNELRFSELRVVKKIISMDSSTGGMHFNIGDKVIPMVCDINRKDKPMSFYEDGTPKVFEVLGMDFVYDGEPLQRLHLQEAMLDSEQ
jgi:hypothetical protein